MGFIDILKKFGVLKVGADSGVYTNAAERPIGLQDDNFMGSDKAPPTPVSEADAVDKTQNVDEQDNT